MHTKMFVERQIALPDGGVDTVTKLSTAVECKEKYKHLAHVWPWFQGISL